MVTPAIAVGQMGHDFQHQQIGPRHHVPGAAIAERADQFFEHVDVKLHRALGRDARPRSAGWRASSFRRPGCRRPSRRSAQHFAVVGDEAVGEIALGRRRVREQNLRDSQQGLNRAFGPVICILGVDRLRRASACHRRGFFPTPQSAPVARPAAARPPGVRGPAVAVRSARAGDARECSWQRSIARANVHSSERVVVSATQQ